MVRGYSILTLQSCSECSELFHVVVKVGVTVGGCRQLFMSTWCGLGDRGRGTGSRVGVHMLFPK
jgi:hypothetical protein